MKRILKLSTLLVLFSMCMMLIMSSSLKTTAEDASSDSSVTYTLSGASGITKNSGTIAIPNSSATYSNTGTTISLSAGKYMTITLSGCQGYYITGITLSMKSNTSSGAGYRTVKIGDKTIEEVGSSTSGLAFSDSSWNGSYSTSYVNVNCTLKDEQYMHVGKDENLVIVIGSTENSISCNSLTITYRKNSLTSFSELSMRSSMKVNYTENKEFKKISTSDELDAAIANGYTKFIIASEDKGRIFTIDTNGTTVPMNLNTGNNIDKIQTVDDVETNYMQHSFSIRKDETNTAYIMYFKNGNSENTIGRNSSSTLAISSTKYYNNISFDSGNAIIQCYDKFGTDNQTLLANTMKISDSNVVKYYANGSPVQLYAIEEYQSDESALRFGLNFSKSIYGDISKYSGVKFGVLYYPTAKAYSVSKGVIATNDSSLSGICKLECSTIASLDSNGNVTSTAEAITNYQYFALISGITAEHYADSITAICYIELDGLYYLTQGMSVSVNSMAKTYITEYSTSPTVSARLGMLEWLSTYNKIA